MADVPAFNWLFSPIEDPQTAMLVKGFCFGVFAKIAESFSTFSQQPDQNILLQDEWSGFQLTFSKSLGENELDPDTWEGAGEVKPEHGHIPILAFALLQKRLNDESILSGKLTFGDEGGNIIRFKKWESLSEILERFGVDLELARKHAEMIGLVDPIVRLDELEVSDTNYFF